MFILFLQRKNDGLRYFLYTNWIGTLCVSVILRICVIQILSVNVCKFNQCVSLYNDIFWRVWFTITVASRVSQGTHGFKRCAQRAYYVTSLTSFTCQFQRCFLNKTLELLALIVLGSEFLGISSNFHFNFGFPINFSKSIWITIRVWYFFLDYFLFYILILSWCVVQKKRKMCSSCMRQTSTNCA